MTNTLTGASVWERDLYKHLTTHAQNERGLLEEYQQAAAESGSAAFSYLVGLIVEEEARHHRWFAELAEALRADAELRSEQPPVPRLDWWGQRNEQMLALTDALLAREREDAKELKRLAKELRSMKDTTLWELLVRLMEADTAKHVEILKFVKDHAREP